MPSLSRQGSDWTERRGRGIWQTGKRRLRNLGDEPISSQGDNGGSSGEVLFSDLFEACVSRMARRSPRRCVPTFSGLYREIPATVGIADFIGVKAPRWRFTERRLDKKLHGLSRGPVAEVLTRLSYRRGMSREKLIKSSQYTRPVVSMAVHGLLKAKVVKYKADQG